MNEPEGVLIEEVESRLTRRGARFEIAWPQNDTGCASFRHAPHVLNDIYKGLFAATSYPFLIVGDAVFSYGDVLKRAGRIASGLSDRFGVGPGVRVGLMLPNGVDWISAFIGVTALGGCAVLVPPGLASLLHTPGLNVALLLVAETCGCDGNADVVLSVSDLLNDAVDDVELPLRSFDRHCEAVIAFTSGSTGQAKGAILTHHAIGQGLMNMMFAGALSRAGNRNTSAIGKKPITRPRPLIVSNLSYISGFSQLLLTMLGGGLLLLPPNEQVSVVLDTLDSKQGSAIVGATTEMIAALLDSQHFLKTAWLRNLTFSGEAVSPSLLNVLKQVLPDVELAVSYGLTETCGAICAIGVAERVMRDGSCGRLVPTVLCKITDSDGNELEAGLCGDIRLRGQMLASGYAHGDRGVDDNGWFRTGDTGYLTADRHLHVLGRNFLMLGGEAVSSSHLERVMEEVSGVANAVALPDANGIIAAYLTISGSQVDEIEIRRRLQAQFSLQTEHVRLFAMNKLPRTVSGKIDRRELVAAIRDSDHTL